MTLSSLNHSPIASLQPKEFERIVKFARNTAGLDFPPSKRPMIVSRLTKRLKSLGLTSFESYCDLLDRPDGADERREAIALLTTNITSFFREPHHFDILANKTLSELRPRLLRGEPIRFWSAGCSRGHEPYSIAMTILERWPDATKHDVKILATDINDQVLSFARSGEYTAEEVSPLNSKQRERFLESAGIGRYSPSEEVRQLIRFKSLNLLHDWPMRKSFHAIFCRNVVIYFDEEVRSELWPRFKNALLTGGWLFLGHSERLTSVSGFRNVAMTTYLKDRHAKAKSGEFNGAT